MAVSKVGLGWDVGERDYDTLSAWNDALSGSTEFEDAWCSGDLGSVAVDIPGFANGALIRGDVEYVGNNHLLLAKLSAPLTIRSSASGTPVGARDLFVETTAQSISVNVSAGNSVLRVIARNIGGGGSTASAITTSSSGIARNCIGFTSLTSTRNALRTVASGQLINCVGFGATNGAAVGAIADKCFTFNNTNLDYILSAGNALTNSASEDATGNITGYTSADLVDFAGGDYRIKATSDLHALGIGAFFEPASSGDVDSAIASTWPMMAVQASQSATAPAYAVTVTAQWPMFEVSASQGAESPVYNSTVAASWPAFTVQALQYANVPEYSSVAALTWPMFTAQASQSQELPAGGATVSVTWPMLSVSASQDSTAPVYSATVAAQWPMFSVAVSQAQSLPVDGQTVNVVWPMLSVSGSQSATVPEYNLTASAVWPMFGVSVLAGEFEYFTAPSARLAAPALSRRLSAPSQSRRITL